MVTSAGGTTQDNIKKSYVKSPSRGGVDTAQEVVIGSDGSIELNDLIKIQLLKDIVCELKALNIMISEMTNIDL